MDTFRRAAELLPRDWHEIVFSLDRDRVEELRFRVGRRPTALIEGREQAFGTAEADEHLLQRVLERATGASLHTAAPSLAEGYFSVGGVRIGVCGAASCRDGRIVGFRRLSSLAIRIPRECRGICASAAECILPTGGGVLILGRPGAGKTTALRDLVYQLSCRGRRVGVVDERCELSDETLSAGGFELGPCTDVLTGVPKAEGALAILRSMNPEYLAMDEITDEQDWDAVRKVCRCGADVIASLHGESLADCRARRGVRSLIDDRVFRYLLIVRRGPQGRIYRLETIDE